MTCKSCLLKPVWKFTNQTQLCKSCFLDYIEKKVFRTIRQFNLLPANRQFNLEKSDSLNTKVLKHILEKKFPAILSSTGISSKNLSQIAEEIFSHILKADFSYKPEKTPLYLVSDAEIEVYAKLKNIKGKKREQNKEVQALFQKFMKKNPDLEINIIKASEQLANLIN